MTAAKDVHAYRASEELAAAIHERLGEIDEFTDRVVVPFDEEHPDHRTLWARGMSMDARCVGFTDGTQEAPPGLSRAQSREELIPRRGKTGQPWRDALEAFKSRPSMEKLFSEWGMETLVLTPGCAHTPGIMRPAGATFITYPRALDPTPEHLAPVPLSEYYAAREAEEARRAS